MSVIQAAQGMPAQRISDIAMYCRFSRISARARVCFTHRGWPWRHSHGAPGFLLVYVSLRTATMRNPQAINIWSLPPPLLQSVRSSSQFLFLQSTITMPRKYKVDKSKRALANQIRDATTRRADMIRDLADEYEM